MHATWTERAVCLMARSFSLDVIRDWPYPLLLPTRVHQRPGGFYKTDVLERDFLFRPRPEDCRSDTPSSEVFVTRRREWATLLMERVRRGVSIPEARLDVLTNLQGRRRTPRSLTPPPASIGPGGDLAGERSPRQRHLDAVRPGRSPRRSKSRKRQRSASRRKGRRDVTPDRLKLESGRLIHTKTGLDQYYADQLGRKIADLEGRRAAVLASIPAETAP